MQSLISDEILAAIKLEDAAIEDKVIELLRLSKGYKDVTEITKYYETSNSVVYKIMQAGYSG